MSAQNQLILFSLVVFGVYWSTYFFFRFFKQARRHLHALLVVVNLTIATYIILYFQPKALALTHWRHAWGFNGMNEEPITKLDWAIYTCDELSGFIIACALVRPEKKLSAVTVEAVQKKWKEKSFAKGVHREQIELCEEKLGIKLPDYIELCIKSLQGISKELGL